MAKYFIYNNRRYKVVIMTLLNISITVFLNQQMITNAKDWVGDGLPLVMV